MCTLSHGIRQITLIEVSGLLEVTASYLVLFDWFTWYSILTTSVDYQPDLLLSLVICSLHDYPGQAWCWVSSLRSCGLVVRLYFSKWMVCGWWPNGGPVHSCGYHQSGCWWLFYSHDGQLINGKLVLRWADYQSCCFSHDGELIIGYWCVCV